MRNRVILLLNLAVLVVNFFVSLGATETQTRVLRTTARVAFSQPLVPPPRPRTRPVPRPAPTARLVKFLARAEELDRLTPAQVDALYAAHDYCRHELEQRGGELRDATYGGARTRRLLGDLRARVRRRVEDTFRAAEVSDRDLLAWLVRVVLASAG